MKPHPDLLKSERIETSPVTITPITDKRTGTLILSHKDNKFFSPGRDGLVLSPNLTLPEFEKQRIVENYDQLIILAEEARKKGLAVLEAKFRNDMKIKQWLYGDGDLLAC